MNTGISTLVELDLPIGELCASIRAAGFSHVSLGHDVRHAGYHLPEGRAALKRILADSGLKLNYIHPPIEAYFDLTSLDPTVRRLSIEALMLPVEACAELGGQALTIHACNEHSIPPEQIAARASAGIESLAELSRRSEGSGVMLCVENQPNPLGSQTITLALLRGGILAGAPGLENVWATLDPNHALMSNPAARELMLEMGPRVRAAHFSDNYGEHDSHNIPFEGKVDWACVAEALGRGGFLAEGPDPWARVGGYTPVADVEASLWMLRKRTAKGRPQPGDPSPELVSATALEDYLARCQSAAERIGAMLEAARG
jgi:sugar phosphate isomerase/epimerase